jgi:hypothetical protein
VKKVVIFYLHDVENNPEWFAPEPEEQPTKERITVKAWENERCVDSDKTHVYSYSASHEIQKEKFPLIKNQIEAVLNDDTDLLTWAKYISPKQHQQKLDKAIVDAIQNCINVIENYYLDNPNTWQSGHLNNVCEKFEKLKSINH